MDAPVQTFYPDIDTYASLAAAGTLATDEADEISPDTDVSGPSSWKLLVERLAGGLVVVTLPRRCRPLSQRSVVPAESVLPLFIGPSAAAVLTVVLKDEVMLEY
jgi:hypothetical protein